MREIMFRGKCLDNGLWVYGSFVMDALEQINGLCGVDGFIRVYNPTLSKIETFEVDRETVGQYTGLKDKNGKKIFEGDIIKGKTKHTYTVEFGNGIAGFLTRGTGILTTPCMNIGTMRGYEVIGNIYDNHELIGGVDNV